MDSFLEYMIEQKRTAGTIVKKTLLYLAAFLLSFIVTAFMLIISFETITFMPLIIMAFFYGAYYIGSSYNVEFEYIVTNGELDIDKIIHKKRRKRLLTIHCKAFIEFGKHNEECKNPTEKDEFSKIIDASSRSKTYDNYYAVFYKNGQKVKLIFNPTQKMIDIFKIYAPRAIKKDM